jgi:hypothetical protein
VSHLAPVAHEIRALKASAAAAGLQEEFAAALQKMASKLQTEPLTWGDPEYHLKKPGGVVYHAVIAPVLVRYAVYETERQVVVLRITPVSPLYS